MLFYLFIFFFFRFSFFDYQVLNFDHFEQMPNIKFRMSKCFVFFFHSSRAQICPNAFFFFFFFFFRFSFFDIRVETDYQFELIPNPTIKFWMSKCYFDNFDIAEPKYIMMETSCFWMMFLNRSQKYFGFKSWIVIFFIYFFFSKLIWKRKRCYVLVITLFITNDDNCVTSFW